MPAPMRRKYAGRATPMPEIRVIAPGRTYRVDSDATHSPMFHQCEGLWIGENVSFKDLKVVFTDFCRRFFETDDLTLRFRPVVLPVHRAERRDRHRLRAAVRSQGQWLEVAGSGQVHPNVVRNFGLDPERHIGFAFGMGPDRLAMLRYGVNDLRLFFDERPALPDAVQADRAAEPPRLTMQFPESWLREFCNPPLDTAAAGRPAHHVRPGGRGDCARSRRRSAAWSWPRSSTVEPHPNADRLSVCQVDAGTGDAAADRLRRAERARRASRCRCAVVGAELPPGDDGKPFTIRLGKLRGVESQGMLCSARELKLIGRPRRPARAGRRCAPWAPTSASS